MTDLRHLLSTSDVPQLEDTAISGYARRRMPPHRWPDLVPVSVDLSEADREWFLKARENVTERQHRIARLVEQGKYREAQKAARDLFFSKACRTVAAYQEIKFTHQVHRRWKRKKPNAVLPETIPPLSVLFAAIRDYTIKHHAYRSLEPKRSGNGVREIWSYGIVDRTRARCLKLAYKGIAHPGPVQYGQEGAGLTATEKRVQSILKMPASKVVIEMDIIDHYGSVDGQTYGRTMGMSQWMIDEVLTNHGKETRGQTSPGNELAITNSSMIRRRPTHKLPQGSRASSLFALAALKPVWDEFSQQFGDCVQIVVYCDNILLVGSSKQLVRAASESLNTLLSEQQAGTFVARSTAIRYVAHGFDFLGKHYSRRKNSPLVSLTKSVKAEFHDFVRNNVDEIVRCREPFPIKRWLYLDFMAKLEGKLSSFRAAPQDLQKLIGFTHRRMRLLQPSLITRSSLEKLERRIPSDEALAANAPIALPKPKRAPRISLHAVPRGFRTGRSLPPALDAAMTELALSLAWKTTQSRPHAILHPS